MINDKIKEILVDYYAKCNKDATIPQALLGKVINTIIAEGVRQIVQVTNLENAFNDNQIYEIFYRIEKVSVKRVYVVKYLKQLKDNKCNYLIVRDKKFGIDSAVVALSKAEGEKLPEFREFILFDNKTAIVNPSMTDMNNILTDDKSTIEACNKWIEFCKSQEKIIYSDDFLQEPLMQSADMLYEVASLCCSHDHVNDTSCQWYHSIWQYLRLLNMVSTPSWHHDFYMKKLLSNTPSGRCAKVLISGTADYSMLAYVINVAKRKNVDAEISVLDLCETPLFACRWYANKFGQKINAMQTNIFDMKDQGEFSMICADAFLTRFKGDQLSQVLNKWYSMLKNGGIAVTTIRVHDDNHICPDVPTEEAVQKFKAKAIERSAVWERHINLTADEVGEKAEHYAKTMVSNHLGTKEHILGTIKNCGFKLNYIEDVEVSGELYPSRYIRVVLSKD